jgi:hypothetical protein
MTGRVSFGPFTLDVEGRSLSSGPDRQPLHPKPKAHDRLSILSGTRTRAVSHVLGRGVDVDVPLSSPKAARRHARIVIERGAPCP